MRCLINTSDKIIPVNRIVKYGILFFLLTLGCYQLKAQCSPTIDIFNHREQINYDINFKLMILSGTAGVATFETKKAKYDSQDAWNYQLIFRTVGTAERVYRMRDTLECYFTPDLRILHSSKRTNEKNHYQVEDISFSYLGNNRVKTRTHRYTSERTKVDTTHISSGCVFDMVGAAFYLRTINWDKIQPGDEFPIKVAIGRDIVNVSFRYTGQQVLDKSSKVKYRTRHFYIDIYDEAFEDSKAAAEVWIGDDENHIPLKVRAKLKIGAAEVNYTSSINLKHPFSSQINLR